MKRILSVVLALVMMMGLATVAFADNTVVDIVPEYDLYPMDKDGRVSDTSVGYTPVASGVTYYIPITTRVDTDDGIKTKNTVSTGYMSGYRLRLDASENKGLITGIQWKVAEGYDYRNSMYIAVTTAPNKTSKTVETTFTITISAKDTSDSYINGGGTEEDFEYTLFLLPSSATDTPSATTTPGATTQQPMTGSGDTTAQPGPTGALEAVGTGTLTTDNVKNAVAAARKNGRTRADFSLTNETGISGVELQNAVNTAKNAGGSLRVIADTTANGAFLGRLYVAPTSAAVVTKDIRYGVDPTAASATKETFEKYYSNTVATIRLAQDDTYGFAVEVAAKPDLSGLDTSKLMFYSYNRATGKFYPISGANYSFDASGFLHFTTTLAGDIVITDKALTAK